jgi:hypothetical protein
LRLLAWQASRALELGEKVEKQQHGAESGFRGKELFQAEAVGSQIMLQFGNAVFHVGAPVAAGGLSPDLLRSLAMSHPACRSLGSVGEYGAKVLLLACCYQEVSTAGGRTKVLLLA